MSYGIIVVFGRRGFGKTFWIKRYLFDNPNQRYLIMDHFHEYEEGDNTLVITSIEELEYIEFSPFDKVNQIIFRGELEFDTLFGAACSMGNVVVVFDEIDMVCSPTNIEFHLNRIIQYGRHLNVGLIGASRRPANVHRNLTSQAMEIICNTCTCLPACRDIAASVSEIILRNSSIGVLWTFGKMP